MATVGISPTGARIPAHRHARRGEDGSSGGAHASSGWPFSYQRIISGSTAVVKGGVVGTVWALGGYMLIDVISNPAGLRMVHVQFAALSIAVLAVVLLVRQVVGHRLRALRRSGLAVCRMLAVGPGPQVNALVDRLATDTDHPYVVVGACVEGHHRLVEDVPQVMQLESVGDEPGPGGDALVSNVLAAAEHVNADAVCIAPGSQFSGHRLRALGWALGERGVGLVTELGMVDVAKRRMWLQRAGAATMLHVGSVRLGGAHAALKVAVDRLAAGLLLLLFLPLLLSVASTVKGSSAGPVIYRQQRVGRGGRIFTMWKFRTMYTDADARRAELFAECGDDGPMFKMRDDPRITPVGRMLRKYSLDELPQLINVLRGEMSLVGPRPPLPEEVERYNDVESRRLLAVPGMTGLWQVSGRSDLSWEETVRLDLRYVDNWSLGLDARVLWRTGRAVVRGTGAY